MIRLTPGEQTKVDFLDTILSKTNPDQLEALANEIELISKLSDAPAHNYIVRQIINEHNNLHDRIFRLEAELADTRQMLETLSKAVIDSSRPTHSTSLEQLKARIGYY